MALDIDAMTPEELFALKEELSRIDVFGPWEKDIAVFCRPEAGKRPKDSRVNVWPEGDGESHDRPAGWYFRVGCGVLDIPAIYSTRPHASAEECMARVDALLVQGESVYLVQPLGNRARPWSSP